MKDESGFTFVETIVGLAVLLTVIGILGLFLVPPARDIPSLSAGVQTTATVAQLQSLLLRVSNELQIPFWWPNSYIESSENLVRIKDLGNLFGSNTETPKDLVAIEIMESDLELRYQGTQYRFQMPHKAIIAVVPAAGRKTPTIDITIPNGTGDPYHLVLKLSALRSAP